MSRFAAGAPTFRWHLDRRAGGGARGPNLESAADVHVHARVALVHTQAGRLRDLRSRPWPTAEVNFLSDLLLFVHIMLFSAAGVESVHV